MSRTKERKKIQLSPSSLNVFLECPKCFWLEYRGNIHRPKGPFPSLPSGMDVVIKKYFDRYRAVGKLPSEIEHQVTGQLLSDIEVLNKWRSWRSGLSYYDKEFDAVLVGALDDCVVHEGQYIPMDYKTRGFDVKEGGEGFYQNQLNCYAFLLEAQNLSQPGYAYLVYFIPKEITEKGLVKFSVEPKKVATDSEAALKVFRDAAAIVRGPMPSAHNKCQFCAWGKSVAA